MRQQFLLDCSSFVAVEIWHDYRPTGDRVLKPKPNNDNADNTAETCSYHRSRNCDQSITPNELSNFI
ncbi:MAG: hypothetical protein KME45_17455 [Stenomitos rutilans HA7619-LM2]|jgi:hypothetical protein|nr:hypothetical protein [Stenomitos rutilans HA7619-LM2]